MQNGICEAFNGDMRDELLNETIFCDLDRARAVLARSQPAWPSVGKLIKPDFPNRPDPTSGASSRR